MEKTLRNFLDHDPHFQSLSLSERERDTLIDIIEDNYLVSFLTTVIRESEEIMAIDPRFERRRILEIAAERIVKDLKAEAASIRLFDPDSLKMLTYGAYNMEGFERLTTVPFRDSIAGQVVRENKSIPVSSILETPQYKDKDIVDRKGFRSLLAVPLRIPRFTNGKEDVLGSIQIYYREEHRRFSPLEIIHAELLARRVSFVLAKKKILDLHRLNLRKEKIVDKIFVKLSNREGVKLKDLFMLLIPELGEFLQVQSCSLFTISKDQQSIHLEATYPLAMTYHEPGYTFTLSHHPYFEMAVRGDEQLGDHAYERIDRSYVLIKNPLKSELVSSGMRQFAREHQIHSILLVPLRIKGAVRHLLAFYATDQKQVFNEDEIELLTFVGKEVMKASRLEFLSDMLHDFKNPAVAVAGLAERASKLLEGDDLNAVRDKLASYIKMVAKETSRLQDLAMTMTGEGHEETVDLCQVAKERYRINEEVIREGRRREIDLRPPQLEGELPVYCPVAGLQRVIDNLLSNATKAIPRRGGRLAMRCFRQETMACLEVRNSGEIPADQIEQVRRGEVKGRGLNIIYRFVQANHGSIDIRADKGCTVTLIKLPLQTALDEP